LRTSEAAGFLNVSPNTLRAWEERFGYPRPGRSPGGQRIYPLAELVALREALSAGLAVSSAVSAAREAVASDEHSLAAALMAFDSARADRAMERGLALRSLEDAVLRILLPALEAVHRRHGYGSAPWAFAGGWAEEWLGRASRLVGIRSSRPGVLVGDCFCNSLDLETLHARVLELLCVRAGMSLLRLPVGARRSLGQAVAAFPPGIVVLAGTPASEAEAIAFTRSVRCLSGPVYCAEYRRNRGADGERERLPPSAPAARNRILSRLSG
jgi:DNA-binding transcriptional MerR regulator